MKSLCLFATLCLAVPACAQSLDSPTPNSTDPLAVQLHQAGDQARVLATQLPSFTCTETGTSEQLHNDKLKRQVLFTASIRAQRSPSGHISEVQTILTTNGKPAKKNPSLPFNVHEAFTDVLSYVDARAQPCFVYKLAPLHAATTLTAGASLRVDFASSDNFVPACGNLPGTTGYFLADASGTVLHMERTVPPSLGDEGDVVPFAAVDLAPVELGGRTYQLASHMVSERVDGKDTYRIDANFTDCKLFKAQITIHTGSPVQ